METIFGDNYVYFLVRSLSESSSVNGNPVVEAAQVS